MWKIKGVRIKVWVQKFLIYGRLERRTQSYTIRIGKNPHFIDEKIESQKYEILVSWSSPHSKVVVTSECHCGQQDGIPQHILDFPYEASLWQWSDNFLVFCKVTWHTRECYGYVIE